MAALGSSHKGRSWWIWRCAPGRHPPPPVRPSVARPSDCSRSGRRDLRHDTGDRPAAYSGADAAPSVANQRPTVLDHRDQMQVLSPSQSHQHDIAPVQLPLAGRLHRDQISILDRALSLAACAGRSPAARHELVRTRRPCRCYRLQAGEHPYRVAGCGGWRKRVGEHGDAAVEADSLD